jgi:hypothetical protein
MGTRFEFFEAKRSAVRVWDAVQTEDEAGEDIGAGRFTLALDGDTVAGFVGTLDELRALAARILREVDAAEPAPDYIDRDGQGIDGHIVGDDDPTPELDGADSGYTACEKETEGRHAYVCTRIAGHAGAHIAGTGSVIAAVWQ